MDPITQGLLGASASQSVYAKKLKKDAAIIGALAGMAPDLDVLIRSQYNPLLFFIYHRGFSHSLLFIPLGGVLVGLIYLLLRKKLWVYWPHVLFAAIIGYATHGLLDATTTYGTELLWPFSNTRFAFNYMSIIDPIFSGILLIGIVISWRRSSVIAARIALMLALCYIGFGAWQHHRAMDLQQHIINARKQQTQMRAVMPNLGSLLSFRSVYIVNGKVYTDAIYVPLFHRTYFQKQKQFIFPTKKILPNEIQKNSQWLKDFVIFRWFSNGYLAVFSEKPYIIVDARYIFSGEPIRSLWGIRFPANSQRKHVYVIPQVPYKL